MRALRGMPWLVILPALAIVLWSLLFIRSAAYDAATGGFAPYTERQVEWALVSFAAFIAIAFVPYDRLARGSDWLYAAGLVALVAVLLTTPVNGSRRWFALGSVRVQPSEFTKYVLVLFLARVIGMQGEKVRTWRGLAPAAAATAAPVALILKQPDLGTALTHVPLLATMLFAAGARLRHFATVGAAAAAALPLAWFFVFQDYQKARVLDFLSPEHAALGGAYQQLQGEIAIGAGGFFGRGFEQGTQGSLGFLPFRHTDFIFAVVGEEWGFVGGAALLVLYGLLVLGLGEVARGTRDIEGRLIVVGVATILVTHVFVNVGMTTGMLPVTGITLPLVSYGGSSLLANLAGLGLAASVGRRKVVVWSAPRNQEDPTTQLGPGGGLYAGPTSGPIASALPS
jgi:rod shape determining protein RodA